MAKTIVMDWLVALAQSAIQSGPHLALIVSVYKGLKHILAPFKPLYDAWMISQAKDFPGLGSIHLTFFHLTLSMSPIGVFTLK